jgi:hypothetical protein
MKVATAEQKRNNLSARQQNDAGLDTMVSRIIIYVNIGFSSGGFS